MYVTTFNRFHCLTENQILWNKSNGRYVKLSLKTTQYYR